MRQASIRLSSAIKRLELRWEREHPAELKLRDGVLTYYYNFIDSPGARRLWTSDVQQSLEQAL